MRKDLEELARDFIRSLNPNREERKFQWDMDDFGRKMKERNDELMKDFRSKINVK